MSLPKLFKFLLSVFPVDGKYLATLDCLLPKTFLLAPVTFNLLSPFPDPSSPDAICVAKSSVPSSFVYFLLLPSLPSLPLQLHSTAPAGLCSSTSLSSVL